MHRRTLLRNAVVLSSGLAFSRLAMGSNAHAALATLRVSNDSPVSLPEDFTGLGYEMSSVATMGLLSARNERYVRLVRQLGSRGVVRVGGIVADYTRFDPAGTPVADMHNTVITRAALEQFGGFLRAVGWSAIWSLNFAQGTIQDAAVEAVAVNEVLGNSLQAFEIGNEVENYARGRAFRRAPYTFEQYLTEYNEWRAAIVAAVPGARFAAPDTAADVGWVERMAQDAPGEVQLLTTHYYRNGQKQGSAEQLTQPDAKLAEKLVRLRAAVRQSGIPWRMCETNSFSGGGLPGVSNTLLGALWTLDFMALLARYGCAGVNMETGVNQLGFISSYSPIQDDGRGRNTAGVPYYGMLAFAAARAGCSQCFAVEVTDDQPGLTAYAFGSGGKVRSLVLVNRGSSVLDIPMGGVGLRQGTVLRLLGPASDSTAGITFGGAAVDESGHWSATSMEKLTHRKVSLPPMSAAVVRSA